MGGAQSVGAVGWPAGGHAQRQAGVPDHAWLRAVETSCAEGRDRRREEYQEEAATLEDLRLLTLLKGVPLWRRKGCAACDGSGVRGAVAIFEYGERGTDQILRGGFQPMVADALGKLLSGQTTLREVVDQVPFTQILQAADRLNIRRVS